MTWWRRKNKEAVSVTKAQATRAIYVDEDTQMVEIRLVIDTGEEVTLSLTPRVSRKLVEQLLATHAAINPPKVGS